VPRARFEVPKAVQIEVQVFQYIVPCRLVNSNRRFGGSYCFHLQCLCCSVLLDSFAMSVTYLTRETAPYRRRYESSRRVSTRKTKLSGPIPFRETTISYFKHHSGRQAENHANTGQILKVRTSTFYLRPQKAAECGTIHNIKQRQRR
jgi:hypothetical protein